MSNLSFTTEFCNVHAELIETVFPQVKQSDKLKKEIERICQLSVEKNGVDQVFSRLTGAYYGKTGFEYVQPFKSFDMVKFVNTMLGKMAISLVSGGAQ